MALVTGCSSGIGEATTLALAAAGFRVFATARNVADMEPLRKRAVSSGLPIELRHLDVLDLKSIDDVMTEIERDWRRLDVVVNNAGYCLLGAIEDIPSSSLRMQFDVNVHGLVAVYRAAMPVMRRSGGGAVVNISSVAGRVSVPLLGAYCATKFSVEALSNAMRAEAHQFGVRVVSIEPGPVNTRFTQNALKASSNIIRRSDSPYSRAYQKLREMYESDFGEGVQAERVARVILRAVRSRRPRARYTVRARDRLLVLAGGLTTTRVGQRFLRDYFWLSPEKR